MPRNLISQRWPSSCSWPWLNPPVFINTSSILRLEPLAFRRLGECTTTSSSPALALSRSTPFPSIELLLSTNHFVNLNEIILCQILWMILPYFLLQHSKCSIMSACFVSWYISHETYMHEVLQHGTCIQKQDKPGSHQSTRFLESVSDWVTHVGSIASHDAKKRKSKAGNYRVRQISKKCPNFATTAHVQREAIVSSGGNKPCDVILCKKLNTFMIDVQMVGKNIQSINNTIANVKKHSSLLIVWRNSV